jgi:hypothetical protein
MISLKKFFFLLATILIALSLVFPAYAQSDSPGASWGDFFQSDGTLKPDVIDGGEVSQPADWMPDVGPLANWGISMEATYHVYTAPDGSTMMTPTASTLLFMAMNPRESGLINANGEVGLGQGFAIQAIGSLAGGNITPQQLLSGIVQALSGNSGITQVQAHGERQTHSGHLQFPHRDPQPHTEKRSPARRLRSQLISESVSLM